MKTTELDADDMLHAQAKAKKRSLAIAGAGLAVLGGGIAVPVLMSNLSAAASRRAAVEQFGYCMLGAPLKVGEAASARGRAMQLTAMADDLPAA